MNREHLNDNDIQQLVFESNVADPKILDHLQGCDLCQKAVDDYGILLDELKSLPEPIMDFDVSEQILEQLYPKPDIDKALNYIIYIVSILCLGIGAVIFILFLTQISNLFKVISDFKNYLIISTAILVMIGLCQDMLRTYNKKLKKLNFQ